VPCRVEAFAEEGGRSPTSLGRLLGIAVSCALLSSLLFALPASATYPGQKGPILFVKKSADYQLWRVNEDGSGLALVADFRSTSPHYITFIGSQSVSQDGRRIALVYIQQGITGPVTNTLCASSVRRCTSIVTMNGDGTNRKVIFSRSEGFGGSIALSPDGHEIALVLAFPRLYLMNADGTNLRQIASRHGGFDALSWSPDGRRLAFDGFPRVCCGGEPRTIFVIDVTGANMRPLFSQARNDTTPDWSPDGNKIVFFRPVARPDYRIITVNVDGTNEREIVANRRGEEAPVWSPDGTAIAFTEFQGQDIAVVNPDGTNLRVVPGASATGTITWAPSSLGNE
jgi:Tol biopolymer transport system component